MNTFVCEFIDSDMIENICAQTNLYHLQKTGKGGIYYNPYKSIHKKLFFNGFGENAKC